jgi:hypothetical protein
VSQRTFLDYLDAGDAAVQDQRADVHLRVTGMAHQIAQELQLLPVGQVLPELAVTALGSGDAVPLLRARAGFDDEELESLEAHLLSGESAYVPRARAACLASLSVHHAAEEATHFVRHWAVGDAMDRPRPWDEAFYARIWEEALGFAGSRIIAPGRPCADLDAWSRTFREEDGERRRIAAYVLAHKAVEKEELPRLDRVRPPRRPRLFHAVTHALGYLLGATLSDAHLAGRLPAGALRTLFRDPLEAPQALYLEWVRLLEAASGPEAHPVRRRAG